MRAVTIAAGLGMLFLCLGLASCRMNDYRKAVIEIPELKDQASADAVLRALSRLPGIPQAKVSVDINRRRVTLAYDSMEVALKNIEHAIRDAGFTANDIPARVAAPRPPPQPEAPRPEPKPEAATNRGPVPFPPSTSTGDTASNAGPPAAVRPSGP